MKNTYYIKLSNSSERRIILQVLSSVFVLIILTIVFISTPFVKTFSIFNLNPDKTNVVISSNLDSVHLDANIDTSNISKSSFLNTNYSFIDLQGNPLSVEKNLNVNIQFAVTSGVSDVDFYIDNPSSNHKLLYSRFLENLGWKYTRDQNISFWQKSLNISKFSDIFISNSDENRKALLLNTYFIENIKLPGYIPSTDVKSIVFPIRGSFDTAFYLGDKEPLNLKLFKRDLNLYEGEDKAVVELLNYKHELIEKYTIPDDGISFVDDKSKNLQELDINKENLSEGLYYLSVDQSDSIIERFDTTLNKFIFLNTLFIANNDIYTFDPKPLSFTVLGQSVTASPVHTVAFQDLKYNDKTISLNEVNNSYVLNKDLNDKYFNITTEKGDILIRTDGYIGFDQSYLFNYQPVITYSAYDPSSINDLDFVFADYIPSEIVNGYYQKKFSLPIPNELLRNDIRLVVKIDKANKDDGVILQKVNFNY